jgi:hypothetical protein
VHNQLSRLFPAAGRRIRNEHTEADRFTALEPVPQDAVLRMTGRLEERQVAIDDQAPLA